MSTSAATQIPVLSGEQPSIGALSRPLVEALLRDTRTLRLRANRLENGTRIVDAGIESVGGLEAGRRIAEICLGGLGSVSLLCAGGRWPMRISVHTAHPVLACLGSQYAGWSLSHGEGKGAFHALGSGPGRALARKEPLFRELGYEDDADEACLVLEVDKQPPQAVVDKIIRDCHITPERLTLVLTPTRSLAGVVQIVARVLEVALHKVHALGFPLAAVADGAGMAPLPPPAADFLTSMGRTNDAILFGGEVQLYVDCDDAQARELAQKLPSGASRDYGKPFAQVFKEYKYDFYQIDPMLFASARVAVTNVASGNTFRGGQTNEALLAASFGEPG